MALPSRGELVAAIRAQRDSSKFGSECPDRGKIGIRLRAYTNDDKAIVSVDYGHLVPWAIAYMTLISDGARRRREQDDIAREQWELVAHSIQRTLLSAHGEELESEELWDTMDRNVHKAARRQGTELKYPDEPEDTWRFQNDLFETLDSIVFEARRFHVGRPMASTGGAMRWPSHVAPIDFPFEVNEPSVIRALEMLDGRGSGKLDLRGMDQPTLYISYRRLMPVMLAAIYVQKQLRDSPEGADAEEHRDEFCDEEWTFAAWGLHDCLRDLHGQELSPDELEQTLTWCLGEMLFWDYCSKYEWSSSFGDDIEAVVQTFIFWAFKVNKLQPPKPVEIDSPKPVQINVPRYIQAMISDGENDKANDLDDGPVEDSWSAWSGADGRSRAYLKELR